MEEYGYETPEQAIANAQWAYSSGQMRYEMYKHIIAVAQEWQEQIKTRERDWGARGVE